MKVNPVFNGNVKDHKLKFGVMSSPARPVGGEFGVNHFKNLIKHRSGEFAG